MASGLALLAVQLVVEPRGTLAFFDLARYSRSDGLWYVTDFSLIRLGWPVWFLVVGLLVVGLLVGRLGWRSAVVLSVLASPRVLVYNFAPLLAAWIQHPGARTDEPYPPSRKLSGA